MKLHRLHLDCNGLNINSILTDSLRVIEKKQHTMIIETCNGNEISTTVATVLKTVGNYYQVYPLCKQVTLGCQILKRLQRTTL